MEERFHLIERWRDSGESIAELARRFWVSRKTVYKWLERYELEGLQGLQDRSSRPLQQAAHTDAEIEQWVVNLRQTHPSWGPKKLRDWLERKKPEMVWPARSTIGLILQRHGLNRAPKKRRHATPTPGLLAQAERPNQVWCIDFKGWFRCGQQRCDPLTVSDAATRFLLCCHVLEGTDGATVRKQMIKVFRTYGLPERIRSDNGSPFGSTGVGGLTRLSVWWIRLGIQPERIEPGEPQQNGRHERMHRTLKQETAKPPAKTLAAQQKRFETFLEEYNCDRPHEALHGDSPAEYYEPSPRCYPDRLPELAYPGGMELRRADQDGKIRWKQARCRVGQALANEIVAVEPIDDGVSRIWFGPVLLGLLDERNGCIRDVGRATGYWPPLQSPYGLFTRRPVTGDSEEKV